jgi:hypothetical protein
LRLEIGGREIGARGVHLHGDRKSAQARHGGQAIERKRVVGAPLRKRVRKLLEVKELNIVIDSEEVMKLKDDARTRECLLSSPR